MFKFRILTYHRIGIPRDGRYERGTIPPSRFARQIWFLRVLRYRIAGLDEVPLWLDGKVKEAGRPVVLTFDDGYDDLYEYAFPVLRTHQIPAIVFLVAGRETDKWIDWGDKGPLKLLSWSQVKRMSAAGIFFGSHTLTHTHLTRCKKGKLQAEVADSKKIIEDRLGQEVRHFSYPYGIYDKRVEDAVREAGYKTACTTKRGAILPGTNVLQLPRLTVGKRMYMQRFLARLMFRH